MYRPLISVILFFNFAQCANILGIFWFPSISHQVVYQPIWKELSLRGHKVTVLTPDPLNDPTLTNLTEISVRFTYEFLKRTKMQEVMSKDLNIFQNLDAIFRYVETIVEAELNSTQFQELIHDDSQHFDLVLVECFNPAMYAFGGRFKAPIIGVSSLGVMTAWYDHVGNPAHPVLYPDILLGFADKELNVWQKIKSVSFALYARYYHRYVMVPRAQALAEKYFGDDIPNVGDLERNQSMLFLNVNPLMFTPRPNVPAIVEMGQMHIKPTKPLPKELQTILDEATEGVVYFSLGSNVKSVDLDPKVRKTIIDALSELPYKVLWKWESDELPGKPKNVITKKWLPQQDVLSHKNIRIFVTQGGLQSTEEAISRGVPLVGLPFMGDQPMNVQKIIELGIGLGLDPTTMSKDELKKSILEVAQNNKYRKRIREVRDLVFDRPMTGLEQAVWWSEYVIRHEGARHLRSPTADVSWFHYLLIDVILTLVLIGSIIIYLAYKMMRLASTYRKNKIKIH